MNSVLIFSGRNYFWKHFDTKMKPSQKITKTSQKRKSSTRKKYSLENLKAALEEIKNGTSV